MSFERRGKDRNRTCSLLASDFLLRSVHILDIFATSLDLGLLQCLHSAREKDESRHSNLRNISKGDEVVCFAKRR